MTKYTCVDCGYIFDDDLFTVPGEPHLGIVSDVGWCPNCGSEPIQPFEGRMKTLRELEFEVEPDDDVYKMLDCDIEACQTSHRKRR